MVNKIVLTILLVLQCRALVEGFSVKRIASLSKKHISSPTKLSVGTLDPATHERHNGLSKKESFDDIFAEPLPRKVRVTPTSFEKNKLKEDALLHLRQKLLARLSVDLDTLATLRPADASADFSIPTRAVSTGSSYTRIWTKKTWDTHVRAPHVRYLRHVLKWPASATARKILPAVAISTIWATTLGILANSKHASAVLAIFKATGAPNALGFLAAPLALLLTIRANASMTRLLEARLLWGRLVLHTRSMANFIRVHLFDDCPQASVLAVRHLAIMGWILKAQLRGESEKSEQDVLKTMLGTDADYQWLSSQRKRSVAVTSRLRQMCSAMVEQKMKRQHDSGMQAFLHLQLEENISKLEEVVGGCERLFGSPTPPTCSRHLSRALSLWVTLVPMSLIANQFLSVPGVAFATALASYVFIGIDEVGMELENCFQMMPLQQLAAAVHNDVRDQFMQTSGNAMPEIPNVGNAKLP